MASTIFFTILFTVMSYLSPSPKRFFTPQASAQEALESHLLYYKTVGTASYMPSENRPSTSQKQQFTIELGVARSQEEAATALEKWEKQGMKAYYTPFYDGKKVIYRIRKGVYHSMKAARKEFKNFKKTDSFSPHIVKM